MKSINRHPVAQDDAVWQRDQQQLVIDATLEPARSNPELLNMLLLNALGRASSLVVADTAVSGCDDLRLATGTAHAIFRAAGASSPVSVQLTSALQGNYQPTGPNPVASALNWRHGFFAAAICRDRAALDALADMPLGILRQSSTRVDECVYLFIEALQSLWKRQPDVGAKLTLALEATDPSRIVVSGVDFVLNVLVPEIELLVRYLEMSSDAFNEALEYALTRHKKFWGNSRHKLDPLGWVAFGPLALASFAFDAELSIAVESDYLPREWYEGACASP